MAVFRIGLGCLALATALASTAALGHGNEVHGALPGPNGGRVAVAGAYHLELVVATTGRQAGEHALTVFVTDRAGAKVSTTGGSGTAVLLSGKTKSTFSLATDGDNRLKGQGAHAGGADLKVALAVTLPGKEPLQARFAPEPAGK